jgi:hypothetical protein
MPPQQIYSQAFQKIFDNENIPKGPPNTQTSPAPLAKIKAPGKKIKSPVKKIKTGVKKAPIG